MCEDVITSLPSSPHPSPPLYPITVRHRTTRTTLNVKPERSKKIGKFHYEKEKKNNRRGRRQGKKCTNVYTKAHGRPGFCRGARRRERRAPPPSHYIKTNKRLLAVTHRPRGGSGGGASLRAAKIMSLRPQETAGEANFRSGSRQQQV